MADDAILIEFLAMLDDYVPAIPEDLVEHYLASAGFQHSDTRLTRLMAVATQKFVSDIAADALHHCKIRQAKSPKGSRLVLTSEDLTAALREFGVNAKKQEYFADNPMAGTPNANANAPSAHKEEN